MKTINQLDTSVMENSNLNSLYGNETIPLSVELSPLVTVPFQNRNTFYVIKDSSLSSFIEYTNEIQKQALKEGKKEQKASLKQSLITSQTIIQYFQPSFITHHPISINNSLWIKKNQLMDIKHNTPKFLTFKDSVYYYNYFAINKITHYYLEDLINLILKVHSHNKRKKNKYQIFFGKILKKLEKKSLLRYRQKILIRTSKNETNLLNIAILLSKLKKTRKNYKFNYKTRKKQKNEIKKKLKYKFKFTKKDLDTLRNEAIPIKKKYKFKLNSKLKFNNKTPFNSLRLKKMYTTYLALWTIKRRKKKVASVEIFNSNSNLPNTEYSPKVIIDNRVTLMNEKIIQLSNNKSLIEDNFKLRHLGSIDQYKDTHSVLYKTLSIEDKKLIDALIFIDSFSQNTVQVETNKTITTPLQPLMTSQKLMKSILPFNSNLSQSNYIMFNFNKKNTYNIFKNEKNIQAILEAAFLSMGGLISKAYFSVKPNSILINLFFFWKFRGRSYFFKINKNKNIMGKLIQKKLKQKGRIKLGLVKNIIKKKFYYSKNYSKFAIIFDKKIKRLTWVLTKLLNKRVDFQFTRIYYPYFDSNILAYILGFISFFVKFKRLVFHLLQTVIFKLKRKRLARLNYRNIPSILTGINLRLAGRYSGVRKKLRVRTSKWQLGSSARGTNKLKVRSNFYRKNRAGVFNINIYNNSTVLN
jgi:hypothetical protein